MINKKENRLRRAGATRARIKLQKLAADGKTGGNIAAAKIVGARLAEKAKAAGIESCAFDRSGYRYHGRVAALAEAAREAGLKF